MNGYLLATAIAAASVIGAATLTSAATVANAQTAQTQSTQTQGTSLGVPNAPDPALAQPNLTQPNLSTNGPAGTAVQTKTTKLLYSNGAELQTSRRFKKSQSYTSGNGALTARTHVEVTGPATTVQTPSTQQEIPQ